MNQRTEGTSAMKFDFVCLSFGKDKEKGLRVVQGALKESVFDENMIIKAENGALRENDTLELVNGQVLEVEKGTYNRLKENRGQRNTEQTDREIR